MSNAHLEKGKKEENRVAELYQNIGIFAHRNSGSGTGNNKRDINIDFEIASRPIIAEVKRQENINMPKWLKQVQNSAEIHEGVPILHFRTSHQTGKVVLEEEDYFELLLGYKSKRKYTKATR